jgi:hypothetical protein
MPRRGARCLAVERGEDGQQEMDKKESGAAPEGSQGLGGVAGERTGQGEVGRLGETRPNGRPPGVRCRVGSQNAVDRGRQVEDKSKRASGFTLLRIG